MNNSSYSKIICELCDRDLRNFYHLKKDLAMKQRRLYELLPATPLFVSCFKEEQGVDVSLKHPEYSVVEALDDAVFEQENFSGDEAQSEKLVEVPLKKAPRKEIIIVQTASQNQTIERETSDGSQKFQCECGLVLSNKFSLKRHVDRVSCLSVCSLLNFNLFSSLKIHKNLKDFHCDNCSYSAFFKHSLERHVIKHIPEEFRDRFNCDLCDFVSISAVNIVLHKKYEHSDNKKFTCRYESCRKEFSRPTQLTAHIRLTHEKRKDKTCCICNKAFSTSKFKG
jgi:hypothetical protein